MRPLFLALMATECWPQMLASMSFEEADSCALLQTQVRAMTPRTAQQEPATQLEGNVGKASQVADLLARDAMSLVTQLQRLHTALGHAAANKQARKLLVRPLQQDALLAQKAQADTQKAEAELAQKAIDRPVALPEVRVPQAPQDAAGTPQAPEEAAKTVPTGTSAGGEQGLDDKGWLTFGASVPIYLGVLIWALLGAAGLCAVCIGVQSLQRLVFAPGKPKIGKPGKAERTNGWDYH
mmetsp:Transcript_17617/g.30865  ORF Transcript_17617/g.30865 Transcript_17617/m.30865 type:complete len:238 (+) Transcript_17617:74-787(+)